MTIESRVSRLERRPLRPPATPSEAFPAHIVEFATDSRFLNLRLYPAQLLILKLATLAIELLTDADHRRLNKWMSGYGLIDDRGVTRYDGSFGTPPDLLQRIGWLRAQGRHWFRNVVLVAGRRSGKSLVASILTSWTVWKVLEVDDPQAALGLPPGKQITWLMFSTTREAATRDVFADAAARISRSACFAPFIDQVTSVTVRLFTRAQLRSGAADRGERGTIVLTAAPTVPTAARGAAVFGLTFDEIAYLDGTAAAAGTETVRAARPASAQFMDAIAIFASTPASQAGVFYEEFRRSTIVDAATRAPAFPDRLVIHLPTNAMSDGWQDAPNELMWPDGPTYPTFTGPLIADEELASERRADPEGYANEFEAIWRAIRGAYFSELTVARLFEPLDGIKLTMADYGRGDLRYVAHGDPAVFSDNFGFVIGHTEVRNDELHVVIDLIDYWSPSDFDEGEVQLGTVEKEIGAYAARFHLSEIHFDHVNSAQMIQNLQKQVNKLGYGTRVGRNQANTKSKVDRYERLKRAINEGRVHCPEHQLLYDETRFLQRRNLEIGAPTSGPVQSDDLMDALSWLAEHLLGPDGSTGDSLASLRPVGTDLDIFNQFRRAVPSRNIAPSNPARPIRRYRNGF